MSVFHPHHGIQVKNKPQLKTIGSIAGLGGRKKIRQYLNQQFEVIGFKPYSDGIAAFAKYQGTINGYDLVCSFSILKRTKYIGISQDHQTRYRTFQGIRMNTVLSVQQKTRLVIAKRITHKWLRRITNLALRYRKMKIIDLNYLEKEVYAVDELFAQSFIHDSEIKNTLQQLSQFQSCQSCLSWGTILIPERLTYGTTFANLDEFDTENLSKRLENITKLAKAIESKPISQELNLTKAEIMARDNPKKLMWRGLGIIFLFILLGMLPFGFLFFVSVKYSLGYSIAIVVACYLIYKYV